MLLDAASRMEGPRIVWNPSNLLPTNEDYYLVRLSPLDVRVAYFSIQGGTTGQWDSFSSYNKDFEWALYN